MSKQITDYGFGVVETRETFYTEETISKLNQQIAELQKQLERHNKYFNSFGCDSFDEFTDFISTFMLTPHEEQTLIKDLKKQLEEKEKIIQMQQNIKRYDIGEMLTENTKLKQQLKSLPAEIVEKIKKEVEEEKDKNDLAWLGFNKLDRILDTILKEYQKQGKEMKQIDIFGNEVEIEEVPVIKQGRKKYKTMQEQHGEFKGFQCKGCKHCIKYEYHGKVYYKCELWFVSNSQATDIRLKNTACKKYEE